jgi:hypothetical protein
MKIIIFLSLIFTAHAAVEFLVDAREFEGNLKRDVYVKSNLYRVRLSKENKDLKMKEALPIFTLTEFAACNRKELTPLRTNSQYEPNYIEAFYRCGSNESLDDWKKRNRLEEICKDRFIESKAQEALCKELGLYK